MKRGLLSSAAALGMMTAPVAAQTTPQASLALRVVINPDSSCSVWIGDACFTLPEDQKAFVTALQAMPDKTLPVILAVQGKPDNPYRMIGGIIYLLQSAGFQEASVVYDPVAD